MHDSLENVYKLKKVPCGLKQASTAWYSEIYSYFVEKGFEKSKSEAMLYGKSQCVVDIFILIFYIDDLY